MLQKRRQAMMQTRSLESTYSPALSQVPQLTKGSGNLTSSTPKKFPYYQIQDLSTLLEIIPFMGCKIAKTKQRGVFSTGITLLLGSTLAIFFQTNPLLCSPWYGRESTWALQEDNWVKLSCVTSGRQDFKAHGYWKSNLQALQQRWEAREQPSLRKRSWCEGGLGGT